MDGFIPGWAIAMVVVAVVGVVLGLIVSEWLAARRNQHTSDDEPPADA